MPLGLSPFHGPMRRIEYGLDSVQGADYVYTLNGWLKGINIPSLNHDLDPGHDGDAGDGSNRTFARDAFGSYDILNRLMGDSIFNDAATGEWTTAGLNWSTRYAYDPNGNITALKRYDGAGTDFDMLGYSYASGTNKLDYINDTNAVTGTHPNDIEDQDPANYTYDLIGNLTADAKENITSITWTPSNKIDSIVKTDSRITYAYDAAGNRVRARVYNASNVLQKTTWYVRDASGTVLSIYEQIESGTIKLKEVPLYGSDRVGMIKPNLAWSSTAKDTIDAVFHRNAKERSYELNDHLGNVRAVVSDEVTLATGGEYLPNVISRTDYYPYGMAMETRTEQQSGYRYGFNSQERDDEIAGVGNHNTADFWEYDTRSARRWNIDPRPNPSISSYACFEGSPIWNVDPMGDTIRVSTSSGKYLFTLDDGKPGLQVMTAQKVYNNGMQWFESQADNYMPIIDINKEIGKMPELKHFSWQNIADFAEQDRWMFSYRDGGSGDWKSAKEGADQFFMVTVDDKPYWADAIGQIPFAVDYFTDRLSETGNRSASIKATIEKGMEFGEGKLFGNVTDKSNTYDNYMLLRGALWADQRYDAKKSGSIFGKSYDLNKTKTSPETLDNSISPKGKQRHLHELKSSESKFTK